MFKKRFDNGSVIKSIFIAYFILLFHVALLAVLGIVVLFFGGIVNYLVWFLIGGGVLVAGTTFAVLRFLKKQSLSLSKLMMLPEFRGKNLEVNLLGGLASMKINGASGSDGDGLIEHDAKQHQTRRIASPESTRVRELTELADLLEKELITPEEYNRAKRELF